MPRPPTIDDRVTPRPPRFDAAFYLPGDSYPRDAEIEHRVRAFAGPLFARWVGPAEAPPAPRFETRIPHRIAALEEMLPEGEALGRTVLFGRSSGARVITELALRRQVLAVICLGYPFRPAGQPPDPRRFAHLARMTVPTLIIQGIADEYGGPEAVAAYPLSPAVTLQSVAANHSMRLSPPSWRVVGRRIMAFCAAAQRAAREAPTRP